MDNKDFKLALNKANDVIKKYKDMKDITTEERELLNLAVAYELLFNKYKTPTVDEPDIDELEEMMSDGSMQTTDGCYSDPDGMCEHGYPSWLLELGMI